MRSRIGVTGCGVISALGTGVRVNIAALHAGSVPPRRDDCLVTSLREPPRAFFVAAALDEDFAPIQALGAPRLDGLGLLRTSKLALVAAREALAQAGLPAGSAPSPALDRARVGTCLGTTVGCSFDAEQYYRACLAGDRPGPEAIRGYLDNDLATVVARFADAHGPLATVVDACASATDAIGLGAQWIARGRCDVVLAGGADALHRFPYLGFGVLRNTSVRDCQPFDRNRAGLNLGEGAGVLVLESEAHARRRGAPILGWIAGYATASDAHHPTAPHPEGRGLRRALSVALEQAGLEPAAIGFVHAHGTGTVHNDRIEGQALGDRFGANVTVFSTKGATGHTMGAAGALGAIYTLCHLHDRRVPPSVGFQTPDPECAVVPTTESRTVASEAAISSSLAFGGTNSVLVLGRGELGPGGPP